MGVGIDAQFQKGLCEEHDAGSIVVFVGCVKHTGAFFQVHTYKIREKANKKNTQTHDNTFTLHPSIHGEGEAMILNVLLFFVRFRTLDISGEPEENAPFQRRKNKHEHQEPNESKVLKMENI